MNPTQDIVGGIPTLSDVVPVCAGQPSRITVLVADGVIVIAVTGRVDQKTAVEFRKELREAWAVCAGVLAVDLSACTYLSVDAVRALQDSWRRPSRRGQLQIIAAHPDVTAALDTANVPRIRA